SDQPLPAHSLIGWKQHQNEQATQSQQLPQQKQQSKPDIFRDLTYHNTSPQLLATFLCNFRQAFPVNQVKLAAKFLGKIPGKSSLLCHENIPATGFQSLPANCPKNSA